MTRIYEIKNKLIKIVNLYNMLYDERTEQEGMDEVNELTEAFMSELNVILLNKIAKTLKEVSLNKKENI